MRRKGLHTLVEAVSLLRRDGLEIRCDIVGQSPGLSRYPTQLRRLIERLGVSHAVTMLGRVSEGELEGLYAGADLFTLPSEHDGQRFEGLGLVYLEALSWGVPVIGSYESGAEDVIVHGENGLLIRPGDVPGLAAAIRSILEDEALRDGMMVAARPSVSHFRWDAVGSRLLEVYRRCAAARVG
jgi:glycosyltransferase involved in cell wall biosynthesis